jgi:hypothetical protein
LRISNVTSQEEIQLGGLRGNSYLSGRAFQPINELWVSSQHISNTEWKVLTLSLDAWEAATRSSLMIRKYSAHLRELVCGFYDKV